MWFMERQMNYEGLWLNYGIPQSTEQGQVRLYIQLQMIIVIWSNKLIIQILNL